MERTYYYRRLHVAKDHRSVGKGEYLTRNAFLEDLNKWNRGAGGVWVYWEIDQEIHDKEMAAAKAKKA